MIEQLRPRVERIVGKLIDRVFDTGRMEAQVASGIILRRLRKMRSAGEYRWRPSVSLRVLERLPIAF